MRSDVASHSRFSRPVSLSFQQVMTYFDRDGSGTVSVTEFLQAVRGSNFTPRRAAIVNVAWSRLETEGDGVVTLDDLATKCVRALRPSDSAATGGGTRRGWGGGMKRAREASA